MHKIKLLLFSSLLLLFVSCSPASYGRIEMREAESGKGKVAYLINQSSDKKITFVINLSWIKETGERDSLKMEEAVGPKQEMRLGLFADSTSNVEIVSAYESK